ncbi:NAD(P)-dependent glycerol-3-phosphate dehydrogenase [Alphaproteobacteria bacterium]|nr:NAD(P)-dependent glycerol-3-phosphate dehydrogenase [Alphaproteobacteria bacterium]
MSMIEHVIIGGGSWGSAIGAALMRAGQSVTMLVRAEETIAALATGICRQHPDIAPVAPLAATIDEQCLTTADSIFVVVPVSATIDSFAKIAANARPRTPVILCAKGLVAGPQSGQILTEVAAVHLPDFPVVIFSGPSFADEVLMGKPAAVTAASTHQPTISMLQQAFTGGNIRLYGNDDPIGVAVGGAVKNVVAIASGCAVGLGLGDNAKATILTRGLSEMTRFAVAMGGQAQTMYGLSGLGDLALTCAGPHSRNMAYGIALGEGISPDGKLAEGRHSVAALAARAASIGIDMPITNAVDRVVNHGDNLASVVASLLARKVGTE